MSWKMNENLTVGSAKFSRFVRLDRLFILKMSGLEGVCCVCVKSDVIIIKTEGKCDGEDGIVFLQQLRDCFPDIVSGNDVNMRVLYFEVRFHIS